MDCAVWTDAIGGAHTEDVISGVLARLDALPELTVDALAAVLATEIGLPDTSRWLGFEREGRCRTLVRRTDRYELIVIGWLPGHGSPVHDHGASACAFRVVRGDAFEERFPRGAEAAGPRILTTHRAGTVVRASPGEVHRVANAPDANEPLVTVHIYAPPLAVPPVPRRPRRSSPTLQPRAST